MKEEFKLSDKEMIMKEHPYYGFSKKDVKEFIKILKEDLGDLAFINKRINKLSGDLK